AFWAAVSLTNAVSRTSGRILAMPRQPPATTAMIEMRSIFMIVLTPTGCLRRDVVETARPATRQVRVRAQYRTPDLDRPSGSTTARNRHRSDARRRLSRPLIVDRG